MESHGMEYRLALGHCILHLHGILSCNNDFILLVLLCRWHSYTADQFEIERFIKMCKYACSILWTYSWLTTVLSALYFHDIVPPEKWLPSIPCIRCSQRRLHTKWRFLFCRAGKRARFKSHPHYVLSVWVIGWNISLSFRHTLIVLVYMSWWDHSQ